jgi:hypothetical protein
LPLALFCAQFTFFLFLAFHRIADSDEGFYLYASKLLGAEGTLIYRDIFYPQMPLLPFIYGGWMKLFGFDWYSGRALSALLTALTGTVLFLHVRASTGRSLFAVIGLLLYAFNLSVLLFFLTAKTYTLSAGLLFTGVIVGTDARGRFPRMAALASGLLLGASVQVRLFFIVAAPVMLLYFWKRGEGKPNRLPWLFCAGFVAGSIPSLVFLATVPKQFIFGTLIYHSVRNPFGLIAQVDQKLGVATRLFLGATLRRPTQFSILFAGVPLGLLFWRKLNDASKMCIVVSVALGIISFLPTPAFIQYFCVLAPFLIVSFVGFADAALGSFRGQSSQRTAVVALLLFSLVYAAWATTRIDGLFIRAHMAPGTDPGTGSLDWKISTIEEVAALVEKNTSPDGLVVSLWPGYLLTANRRAYPGTENHFARDSSMRISPEECARYRMMRGDRIDDAIADPATQAVILGNWSHNVKASFAEVLEANNYESVGRIVNTEVFARSGNKKDNSSG